MAKNYEDDSNIKNIKCSFCGKAQENVRKIVAGPRSIYL